jgi:hypothetical protein
MRKSAAISIFMRHRVKAGGALQRNNFFDVRDGDSQRGIKKAVANNWIVVDLRNRYRYQLTATSYAAEPSSPTLCGLSTNSDFSG